MVLHTDNDMESQHHNILNDLRLIPDKSLKLLANS